MATCRKQDHSISILDRSALNRGQQRHLSRIEGPGYEGEVKIATKQQFRLGWGSCGIDEAEKELLVFQAATRVS